MLLSGFKTYYDEALRHYYKALKHTTMRPSGGRCAPYYEPLRILLRGLSERAGQRG
jgi:hypothetical protein